MLQTAEPFGDVRPEGHCVHKTAPDVDKYPFWQGSHTELVFAPSTSLLDPGGQSVHVVDDTAATAEEYKPGSH